jgi:DNA-binding NtrC family response regulator
LEAYGRRAYDVVLLDVSMPGMGGLRALEEIQKADAEAVVVMITAYATFDTAVAAWERGAFGCIRKPFKNEQVTATIAAGVKRRRKEEERQTLRRAMGRSVARAIHDQSPRATKAFMPVNSSNIPSELLESELFGHTRGAFTGAFAAKKGLFEVADGGSVFLDEIGNIPPETQAKLLRVIQEREFTPLGDTTARRVDVRIIAATNIDLKEAVRQGTFREDLYYRLAVVPIELPPLRERREDILPLAQHFIRKYNEENARHISDQLAPDVLALMEAYTWPGNVRELENVMERAVVIAPTDEVTSQCLPTEICEPQKSLGASTSTSAAGVDVRRGIDFYDEVRRFEVDLIRRALEQTGGHQSRAARLLGMNATTLNSKIKTYNIQLRS